MLGKYVGLQDTRLLTDESEKIFQNTAEAVLTLKDAFRMQFQKLMQNELMDMEADLNLLRQTLRSEGYEVRQEEGRDKGRDGQGNEKETGV